MKNRSLCALVITAVVATTTILLPDRAMAAPPATAAVAVPESGKRIVTFTPLRIVDTRPDYPIDKSGLKVTGRQSVGDIIQIPIAGKGVVPPAADGVILNVTAVAPTSGGYVTVYPCGSARPSSSNLNLIPGQTRPNAVISKIGKGGKVCVYSEPANGGSTDIVVDLTGYSIGGIQTMPPKRLVDTRPDRDIDVAGANPKGRRSNDSVTKIPIVGRLDIPKRATGVVLNVTAVAPNSAGYMTAYPCDEPRPSSSNVNLIAGVTTPNLVISKLSDSGEVCVFTRTAGGGRSDMIVDISGFVTAETNLNTSQPTRFVDTRPGEKIDVDGVDPKGRQTNGAVLEVPIAGRGGIPADATGVSINVTAVQPSSQGFVSVYPCGSERPESSSLNLSPRKDTPNSVVTSLSKAGTICIFSAPNLAPIGDQGECDSLDDSYGPLTPSLDELTTDPLTKADCRPAAVTGSTDVVVDVTGYTTKQTCAVGEFKVTSHTSGETVDTSNTGTATGSVLLEGVAPTTSSRIRVSSGGESVDAEVVVDHCVAHWKAEAQVLKNETRTFNVDNPYPGGRNKAKLSLKLIAPRPDDMILDPTFADTNQHTDELISLDPQTGELIFAGDLTGDLVIGDGLGGGPSKAAPDGYLRIVTGVEFVDGVTVVSTTQAGLTDFVRKIDVAYEVPPSGKPTVRETPNTANADGGGESADLMTPEQRSAMTPEQKSAAAKKKDLPDVNAYFDLDPGMKVVIDIDVKRDNCTFCLPSISVNEVLFEASMKVTGQLEITKDFKGFSQKKTNIGPEIEIPLPPIYIPTPTPIQIVIKSEIEAQAFYEYAVNLAIEYSAEASYELKVGFQYKGNGTGRGPYVDGKAEGNIVGFDNIKVGILGEFSLGAEVDLEALFWGQVGFEIEAAPQFTVEAKGNILDQTVDVEFALEIPFAGGIEIEIKLGPIGWEKEFGKITWLTYKRTLFQKTFGAKPDDTTDDVVGDGVEVVDDDIEGDPTQWGKVGGFVPGEDTWVLSTGRVSDAVGSPSTQASTPLGLKGNSVLSALAGYPTADATAYQVTVRPKGKTLRVRYVFASEEYPQYVGSQFNDVMGVFINGKNCALIPGTKQAVSINTVNAGKNSSYFVDNSKGAAGYGTTMNGLTKPLTCSVPVTPGKEYTVRIAVADASDGILDSAVALLDQGIWSE